MTQVFKLLPMWNDTTPIPARRKQPFSGFSDLRKGHGGVRGSRRLTDDEVRSIRLAGEWGWSRRLVASLYGVTAIYIGMVMRGDTHAHVRE